VRAAKNIPDEEVTKVDVPPNAKEGEVPGTAELSDAASQSTPVVAATA